MKVRSHWRLRGTADTLRSVGKPLEWKTASPLMNLRSEGVSCDVEIELPISGKVWLIVSGRLRLILKPVRLKTHPIRSHGVK